MTGFSMQDFLQDFLEESAEHLSTIQGNLLALEGTLSPDGSLLNTNAIQVSTVNELFRSYHTLKGLAGMIGLKDAEEISHALESVLRAIQRAEIEITPPVIDRLMEGSQALEAVITTVRKPDAPAPLIGPHLKRLAALLPEPITRGPPATDPGSPSVPEEAQPTPPDGSSFHAVSTRYPELSTGLNVVDQEKIKAARREGNKLFLAIFTPSAEKSEEGININRVRTELLEQAEILKSIPVVRGASVQFAMLVASPEPLDPGTFVEMEWIEVNPGSLPDGAAPLPADRPKQPMPEHFSATTTPSIHSAVRVDLERLDELMNLVSELVITRSRISDLLPKLKGAPTEVLDVLGQSVGKMERQLRRMRQTVVRTRMVPLAEVFNHMPLAVRDLARSAGKEIRLQVHGENTEVDKLLVERLLEPLLHLVRNSLVHGIETPEERRRAGKPAQGTVEVCGEPAGEYILITVTDDGRGIDTKKVATRAVEMGWLEAERLLSDALPLTNAELLELICRPGLSTREETDLGAGRGVGMDVVLKTVTEMAGHLELVNKSGQGTTFTLRLPLTLTIVDALIVRCGRERYAIPQSSVDEVVEVDPAQILSLESGEIYPFRNGSLTLVRLERLFHLTSAPAGSFLYGLITLLGERRTALLVDGVVGLREVVVRTLSDPLIARPGITGATDLGDGTAVLILDIPSLLAYAKNQAIAAYV